MKNNKNWGKERMSALESSMKELKGLGVWHRLLDHQTYERELNFLRSKMANNLEPKELMAEKNNSLSQTGEKTEPWSRLAGDKSDQSFNLIDPFFPHGLGDSEFDAESIGGRFSGRPLSEEDSDHDRLPLSQVQDNSPILESDMAPEDLKDLLEKLIDGVPELKSRKDRWRDSIKPDNNNPIGTLTNAFRNHIGIRIKFEERQCASGEFQIMTMFNGEVLDISGFDRKKKVSKELVAQSSLKILNENEIIFLRFFMMGIEKKDSYNWEILKIEPNFKEVFAYLKRERANALKESLRVVSEILLPKDQESYKKYAVELSDPEREKLMAEQEQIPITEVKKTDGWSESMDLESDWSFKLFDPVFHGFRESTSDAGPSWNISAEKPLSEEDRDEEIDEEIAFDVLKTLGI